MDMNVEDLKKLSLKMKALIVFLICLLLGYFYYMFFFQEILAKKMSLDTKLTEMQQQIAEKEKVVAQLDRYIREINCPEGVLYAGPAEASQCAGDRGASRVGGSLRRGSRREFPPV